MARVTGGFRSTQPIRNRRLLAESEEGPVIRSWIQGKSKDAVVFGVHELAGNWFRLRSPLCVSDLRVR